jgi:hypothetical protein
MFKRHQLGVPAPKSDLDSNQLGIIESSLILGFVLRVNGYPIIELVSLFKLRLVLIMVIVTAIITHFHFELLVKVIEMMINLLNRRPLF